MGSRTKGISAAVALLIIVIGVLVWQRTPGHSLSVGMTQQADGRQTQASVPQNGSEEASSTPTGSIHITSPIDGVTWNQNTDGKWTWSTEGDVSAVDIYLQTSAGMFSFASKYPNNGEFWWAAGFTYPDWHIGEHVENGTYKIIVCPQDQPTSSPSCGSFEVNIAGTIPAPTIIAPRSGETYKPGQSIAVTFTSPQNGDAYDVFLAHPAKVSDFTIKLGTIHATVPGPTSADTTDKTQTISFVIPKDADASSDWFIMLEQTLNHGAPCVNVCGYSESAHFVITE